MNKTGMLLLLLSLSCPLSMAAQGDQKLRVLVVRSGDQFYLDADGTMDPGGDSMSYLWFQYPEAGSNKGYVSFAPYASNLYRIPVTAPKVERSQTVHFILRVTDKGTPALTRHKRVIVTVEP